MIGEPIRYCFHSECGLDENRNLLIYIGGSDSKELDSWVKRNLALFPSLLEAPEGYTNKYRVVFLPSIAEGIIAEAISYNYPHLKHLSSASLPDDFPYEKVWNDLLSYSPKRNTIPQAGGFLQFVGDYYELKFDFFPITGQTDDEFLESFKRFSRSLPQEEKGILHSSIPTVSLSRDLSFSHEEKDDSADALFDSESRQLADEIRERIDKLRLRGIDDLVIRSLFEPKPKLSRLTITKDYRIFLPDFNDMEIKIEPLPKAVYFLFLRHPEGILFKNLPDYEVELRTIYQTLTNRVDISSSYESIKRLVDPYDNSINEKCARIRSAFLEKMDDRVASNYYVTGERNSPKCVRLIKNSLF